MSVFFSAVIWQHCDQTYTVLFLPQCKIRKNTISSYRSQNFSEAHWKTQEYEIFKALTMPKNFTSPVNLKFILREGRKEDMNHNYSMFKKFRRKMLHGIKGKYSFVPVQMYVRPCGYNWSTFYKSKYQDIRRRMETHADTKGWNKDILPILRNIRVYLLTNPNLSKNIVTNVNPLLYSKYC